jgi:hypothetical protein
MAGSGAGLVGRGACGWGSGMPAPSGQMPPPGVVGEQGSHHEGRSPARSRPVAVSPTPPCRTHYYRAWMPPRRRPRPPMAVSSARLLQRCDHLACRAAPVRPSFTTALAPPAGGAHVHEPPRQAPTVSPSVQPVPAPAAGALAHLPHDPHPSSGERAQDGRHEQEDCQYPQQQSPDVHGCPGLSSNRTASGVREPARAELSPLSVPMPVASAWQGCGRGGWRPTIRR